MRDLIVPLGVVAVFASMILPLPPGMLDFLLVANLVLALVLMLSALYISEPLKLSSLPTILLLATLYRLALNISTTRLVLAGGYAGEVVQGFGSVVAQGNLVVGAVVFLVITLVQFIVVAKGSERVAEVAARFTLDAMPGRQMSIDADVRAGLIDIHTAREKRQELQTESRFYGALDGAMKFVKGDAIAGMIIIAINIIGGLLVGTLMHGMDLRRAASTYTILTIGDGLLSQIPSLLNSLAAGMVVTRVTRGDNESLANEVLNQLGQLKKVKVLIGVISIILGLVSGLPVLPFLVLASMLLLSAIFSKQGANKPTAETEKRFKPKSPPLIQIELGAKLAQAIYQSGKLIPEVEAFREKLFEKHGLIILPPDFTLSEELGEEYCIKIRGIKAKRAQAPTEAAHALAAILKSLEELSSRRAVELIDDIMTRRILDHFENESPELAAAVVPGVVTLTQLTEILKGLAGEQISIANFDLILQAVAECGHKAPNERVLLEDVRVALKRVISEHYAKDGIIRAITLDPLMDLNFAKAEREKQAIDVEQLNLLVEMVQSPSCVGAILVSSKGARRIIGECLLLRGCRIPVIAIEEVADDVRLEIVGRVSLTENLQDGAIERLAA